MKAMKVLGAALACSPAMILLCASAWAESQTEPDAGAHADPSAAVSDPDALPDPAASDPALSDPAASEPAVPDPDAVSDPAASEQQTAPSAVAGRPVSEATRNAREQASRAQKRAESARTDGKRLVAARYAQAQKMWLQVAATLERAATLEKQAAQLESETTELEARSRRAATLVEQTEARRARAWARLKELGLAPQEGAPPSAAQESAPPSAAQEGAPPAAKLEPREGSN